VTMSTTTSGATIFYTDDGTAPTHNGSAATGTTQIYASPYSVLPCGEATLEALAYKAGYLDSTTKTDNVFNGGGGCNSPPPAGGGPNTPSATVTIFSVWDGDWAILEEYTTGNVLVEKYLQGYHGLVKTFQTVAYYYQDELGSTSHVADGSGGLIESYQYDLYGKPRVYNASGVYQPGATPQAQDLFTGQRWRSELGLYDDRNRFMSPDLGRFLQPDPIGFKGDASNLYRYCGNDWANKNDPMGTTGPNPAQSEYEKNDQDAKEQDDKVYAELERVVVDDSPEGGHNEFKQGPTAAPGSSNGHDIVVPASAPSASTNSGTTNAKQNSSAPVQSSGNAPVGRSTISLPGHFQSVNVSVGGVVSVSTTYTRDIYNRRYISLGFNVGFSPPVSLSGSISDLTNRPANRDTLQEFLTGESITANAGFIYGRTLSVQPNNVQSSGTGLFMPQIGVGPSWSWQIGGGQGE
jgi:RHS repeat-associated protein